MHDYRELTRLMEKSIHKYIQLEKQPRCYGTGIVLSQAEVHTIAIVGDFPDINVTKLASMRGITKGAASQMVYKLVDKGFIEKRVSPNSDTEVCLSLTENGKITYKAHAEYHEKSGTEFFKELSDMPKEYEDYFIRVLKAFNEAMDKRMKEK